MLWGLDADGKFLTKSVEDTTLLGRLKALFMKKDEVNVQEAVLMDLKNINAAVRKESSQLTESSAPKHEIGKKLLFLFQCDLLPGISGKILELKGSRDSSTVKRVSLRSKILGYTFLFAMNVGMLFYIFLFALTQTGPKQNAWFQSFALWLVVEILLVSTAIVFFTHILIPSMVMKDLTQIKRRLMDNIRDFNEKVQAGKGGNKESALTDDGDDVSFNAANFLFVSTRLARQFPDLKESKIISQFSTPWPRQSYLRVQNVSKGYSKKFSALTRSASILIIFFVGNFLAVPPSVQDIAVQMTSTTAIGYIMYIHVQLYEIFPVLVILPALVVAVLVHFVIQSSKSDAKIKLARLFPSKKKNLAALQPAGDADNGVAAVEAEIIGEESKHEYDSSDDYSISSEDPDIAVAIATANPHRTRRQSINAGLNVLNALRQNQLLPPPVEASSNSDSDSDLTSLSSEGAHDDDVGEFSEFSSNTADSADEDSDVSDSSSSGSENDEESRTITVSGEFNNELHTALGTPQTSPRVAVYRKNTIKVSPTEPIVEAQNECDSNSEDDESGDESGSESDFSGSDNEDDQLKMPSTEESKSMDSASVTSRSYSHSHSSRSGSQSNSHSESHSDSHTLSAESALLQETDAVEDFAMLSSASSVSDPHVPSRPSTTAGIAETALRRCCGGG